MRPGKPSSGGRRGKGEITRRSRLRSRSVETRLGVVCLVTTQSALRAIRAAEHQHQHQHQRRWQESAGGWAFRDRKRGGRTGANDHAEGGKSILQAGSRDQEAGVSHRACLVRCKRPEADIASLPGVDILAQGMAVRGTELGTPVMVRGKGPLAF